MCVGIGVCFMTRNNRLVYSTDAPMIHRVQQHRFLAEITCPAPPFVANATYTPSENYTLQSVVTFTCDNGFDMEAGDQLVCNGTGEWGGDTPTCTGRILRGLLLIIITSWIVRSRSRSCGGGDICGTTPAFKSDVNIATDVAIRNSF